MVSLCVVSVASEFGEPLPTGEAAFTVLMTMVVGYAVGWLDAGQVTDLFWQDGFLFFFGQVVEGLQVL